MYSRTSRREVMASQVSMPASVQAYTNSVHAVARTSRVRVDRVRVDRYMSQSAFRPADGPALLRLGRTEVPEPRARSAARARQVVIDLVVGRGGVGTVG